MGLASAFKLKIPEFMDDEMNVLCNSHVEHDEAIKLESHNKPRRLSTSKPIVTL
jgi:hypothetical protein